MLATHPLEEAVLVKDRASLCLSTRIYLRAPVHDGLKVFAALCQNVLEVNAIVSNRYLIGSGG